MSEYEGRAPRGLNAGFPMSYRALEQEATRVRQIIVPDVGWLDPIPGLELFEGLRKYGVPVQGRHLPLNYEVRDLPPGTEAQTEYDARKGCISITLSAKAYASLEDENPRAIHTLAHEIGHAVLHHGLLFRLHTMPHHQRAALMRAPAPSHRHFEDTEWMADSFAAALRTPARSLHALEQSGMLTEAVIQRMFKVSALAAQIRLEVYHRRKNDLLK